MPGNYGDGENCKCWKQLSMASASLISAYEYINQLVDLTLQQLLPPEPVVTVRQYGFFFFFASITRQALHYDSEQDNLDTEDE